MAFDVMNLIQDVLQPEHTGAIASALDMDQSLVKKGLAAALPALLGSVLGAAQKPEGGQALDSTLGAAEDNLLGSLGQRLSGDGGGALIAAGGKLLSGLLGEKQSGMLGGALASELGVSKESSGKLLGIAAPLLMSMLAGKRKSEGMDTGGLVSALLEQKGAIGKALPEGLGRQLAGSGIMDDVLGSVGSLAGGAAAAASATVDTAVNATQQVAEKSSSWRRWVIIAAVVLAVFYFFSGNVA